MSGETLSAEQVRELLEGVTPGRWEAVSDPWWSGVVSRLRLPSESGHMDDSRHVAEVPVERDAALMAAAPTLAHTALSALARAEAAEAEVERLRGVLAGAGILGA